MSLKILGAILVLIASAGLGMKMSISYIKQERQLDELIQALSYVKCELPYRLTPLPAQFDNCGNMTSGAMQILFRNAKEELDSQISPNAKCCLLAAIDKTQELMPAARQALERFAQTLGQFDVDGQLLGITETIVFCEEQLQKLKNDHPNRIRNYQTLGLCAGAAIVILFV